MTALRAPRLRATDLAAPPGLAERLFAHPGPALFWDDTVGLGEAAAVEARDLSDLRHRARALLAAIDGPAPPLFGGVAFAPGFSWTDFGDARFVLPRWTYRGQTLTYTGPGAPPAAELRALLDPPPAPSTSIEAIHREPRAAFAALVRDILDEIAAGHAEKIVAARRTHVDGSFADAAVLAGLPRASLRFAFRRGATTFLGSTPERLLAKHADRLLTEAVAGTSASGCFGAKDRAEHAPVVAAITAALARAGARLEVAPSAPRALPDLTHLVTSIEARLDGPAHILDLAAALHPTPAVAGSPREQAIAWIRAHEPPRGWYTGAVGWFDASGDGELRVALRCALLTATRATLFAGAGVVAASDPDAEYDETLLKERPMLRALGAS